MCLEIDTSIDIEICSWYTFYIYAIRSMSLCVFICLCQCLPSVYVSISRLLLCPVAMETEWRKPPQALREAQPLTPCGRRDAAASDAAASGCHGNCLSISSALSGARCGGRWVSCINHRTWWWKWFYLGSTARVWDTDITLIELLSWQRRGKDLDSEAILIRSLYLNLLMWANCMAQPLCDSTSSKREINSFLHLNPLKFYLAVRLIYIKLTFLPDLALILSSVSHTTAYNSHHQHL